MNAVEQIYAHIETINHLDAQLSHMFARAERDARAYRAMEIRVAKLCDAHRLLDNNLADLGFYESGSLRTYVRMAIALTTTPDAEVLGAL